MVDTVIISSDRPCKDGHDQFTIYFDLITNVEDIVVLAIV